MSGLLGHSASGLHSEGDEVCVLSVGHLLVLDLLAEGGLVSCSDGAGAGSGDMRGGERVSDDDISEEGGAGKDDSWLAHAR